MVSFPMLDRTDRAIVGLLQHNARLSNKEIAAQVGIAQSTCSERIRRLETTGVFRGFHADIDPTVVGVGLQAMIAVRLHRHETTQVARFRKYAEQLPEVVAFYHMAGTNDFLVHVVVRDSDHLREPSPLSRRLPTSKPRSSSNTPGSAVSPTTETTRATRQESPRRRQG